MLDGAADREAHDALNPDNIKTSTNTINSPIGECLYLHDVQVDSEGLATRV